MRNQKGSYTVFLVMFFSGLMILVWAVIVASAQAAVSSTVNHFGRLWGTSILAEYDLNLKDRYGLYGFYGERAMVELKLDQYAEYSFQGKSYIDYEGAFCSLDGYSLADFENVKIQMGEAVLYGNRPSPLYRTGSVSENSEAVSGPKGTRELSRTRQEASEADSFGCRTITSRWILENLPSAGKRDESDITSAAEAVKSGKGLEALAGSAAVNQYIFKYFRHLGSEESLGDTYFQNEIEYILCGKADDERARKKAKQKLVLLRNILNLTYLYSCPEKREAAMTLASVMTPGPEAVLTQGVLLELWAYAEAENDVAMLYDNQKVPLLKGDQNWALTLENAVGTGNADSETDSESKLPAVNRGESDSRRYIKPQVTEGADYGGYLRILLNAIPEKTRVLRAMDLIQINMKYLYCDYFRLEDYYTGLAFSMTVNGVKHEFEETYERKETAAS